MIREDLRDAGAELVEHPTDFAAKIIFAPGDYGTIGSQGRECFKFPIFTTCAAWISNRNGDTDQASNAPQVIIDNCASNCSAGGDGVAGTCGEGEGDSLIGLDFGISYRINHHRGGGRARREGHRLGSWKCGNAYVICDEGGGTPYGVVDSQLTICSPCANEGKEKISVAIFSGGCRCPSQ